ncbi:MAG: response regulator [Thermoplasmatota archaeon]
MAPTSSSHSPPWQGKTILVVDDEPDLAASICDLVQAYMPGIEVISVRSAEEALRLLPTRKWNLILTDYRMPGLSGLDLLAALAPEDRTPRVLMTAYPGVEIVTRAIEQFHVDSFLRKPMDPAKTMVLIEQILRGNRTAHERSSDLQRVLDDLRRRDSTT